MSPSCRDILVFLFYSTMQRIYSLIVCLLLALTSFAVPARKGAFIAKQPDGTKITLYNHGDESFHYLTNEQGQHIIQNAEGTYCVAPTDIDSLQRICAKRKNPHHNKPQTLNLNFAQRGLIILANFTNQSFQPENNAETLYDMYNGINYTYNGATGSARQYFTDQSMGAYVPQFDIVGPIDLPYDMEYYGANNRAGNDLRPQYAIRDACLKAKELYNIDFSQYDCDNDGSVDFVFLVYAGHNEAEGASTTTIWPHAWNMQDAGLYVTIDNKLLGRYACTSELRDNQGTERAGIGTFCHEFGHVLGLPDLYATNNQKIKTQGAWDIMDYGPYNNNGRTPPAYSAYERFFLGWTRPLLLNQPANHYIREIQSSNACGMITETGNSNLVGISPNPATFYLIENRQQTGWDTYLPGHGLMITKVQFDEDYWAGNIVNNEANNLRIELIKAAPNDDYNLDTITDLFPAGKTQYIPNYRYPLLNIQEENDIISFQFMTGGDTTEITFNKKDEIEQAAQNELFTLENSCLHVIAELSEPIRIFNTIGQEIYCGNNRNIPLSRGIYFVLLNKKSYKICN